MPGTARTAVPLLSIVSSSFVLVCKPVPLQQLAIIVWSTMKPQARLVASLSWRWVCRGKRRLKPGGWDYSGCGKERMIGPIVNRQSLIVNGETWWLSGEKRFIQAS